MDLNTFVNAGSRIVGLVAIPVVIYFGFGLVGAMVVLLAGSTVNLFGQFVLAKSATSKIVGFSIERAELFRVVRFGAGLTGASLAFLLLGSLDKGVLSALMGVEQLAYYSVAFTVAGLMTMFSQAMTQSLLPALSRLINAENREFGGELYSRALRLNLMVLIPALAVLAVFAGPFIGLWAGETFERESLIPFYLLLVGVLFNLPAYLPMCAIIASGKTNLLAKIYLIELVPYIAALYFLTSAYGTVGTAVAWSIRSVVDSIAMFFLAKRFTVFVGDWSKVSRIVFSGFLLLVPVILIGVNGGLDLWVVASLLASLLLFAIAIWLKLLSEEESVWLRTHLVTLFARAGGSK